MKTTELLLISQPQSNGAPGFYLPGCGGRCCSPEPRSITSNPGAAGGGLRIQADQLCCCWLPQPFQEEAGGGESLAGLNSLLQHLVGKGRPSGFAEPADLSTHASPAGCFGPILMEAVGCEIHLNSEVAETSGASIVKPIKASSGAEGTDQEPSILVLTPDSAVITTAAPSPHTLQRPGLSRGD